MPDPERQTLLEDVWANGAAYERFVGRWSRQVSREFLDWLAVPPGHDWIDVGCGTGALSQTILQLASPQRVHAIDRSLQLSAFARRQAQSDIMQVVNADAQALPFSFGICDAVVSGLVLNFVPDPRRAVEEMARTTRSGGIVAVYVWDYSGGMEFLRYFWDAATELESLGPDYDEGRRFPICQPEPLASSFEAAGLKNVQVRSIDIPTAFRDFDDYWDPFLGGQGAAPTFLLSLEVNHQDALRDLIQKRLPIAPDGSIHLIARAWAARGTR